MSQISATFNVTINRFRPLGGVFPISASFALPVPVTGITLSGKTISVSVPAGTTVQLIFNLPDPNFVLLGIAFAANESGPVVVGRQEFPSVSISRSTSGSQMTVLDACISNFNDVRFNYVIMVQSLRNGDIGLIDPAIVSENDS